MRNPDFGMLLEYALNASAFIVLFLFIFLSLFSMAVAINKKAQELKILRLLLSGWQDSNLRPPRPKRGAITGLRYTPNNFGLQI